MIIFRYYGKNGHLKEFVMLVEISYFEYIFVVPTIAVIHFCQNAFLYRPIVDNRWYTMFVNGITTKHRRLCEMCFYFCTFTKI